MDQKYKGWIFANAKSPVWTQVLFKQKYKFQNPLHQNYKHVKAVQALLDFLPAEHVRSSAQLEAAHAFVVPDREAKRLPLERGGKGADLRSTPGLP